MGTMSQHKRPHKRYTPKFFHCDDVPRQTTSSDMPELVSFTKNSFTNKRPLQQARKYMERVFGAVPCTATSRHSESDLRQQSQQELRRKQHYGFVEVSFCFAATVMWRRRWASSFITCVENCGCC